MKLLNASFTVIFTLFFVHSVYAQNNRIILTGASFLKVAPDARSAGMGDIGIASGADVYSQYWNPAKYLFSKNTSGIGVSYTPLLSQITNDVFLLNGSYYTFLDQDQRSVLGASINYFSLGDVELNELAFNNIVPLGIAKPAEFSVDISYGLRLSDTYGMAAALRYIRSDVFNNDQDAQTQAANTFAVDLGGYFESDEFNVGNSEGKIRAGFNVKNLGPKLNYINDVENANFLPTNLGIGGGYDMLIDRDHKVGFNLEFNKLLVPTPVDTDGDGNPDLPDDTVIGGIFSSFTDSPDGFSEELKEVTYAIGTEYVYKDSFAARLGYFHESEEKGSRQFLTVGAGFIYSSLGVDVSYLIPTISEVNSALDGTLRFSLSWNLGGELR